MKKLLLLTTVLVLAACGGVKKTQEALNTGNYGAAMNKAIKNLAENKVYRFCKVLHRWKTQTGCVAV